jgi:hypothetical protein
MIGVVLSPGSSSAICAGGTRRNLAVPTRAVSAFKQTPLKFSVVRVNLSLFLLSPYQGRNEMAYVGVCTLM